MPRSTANKNYRTFVAGLITEASPLTYPENASTSEDNCVIFQKGNRTRRLGFAQETGGVQSSYSVPSDRPIDIHEFSWEAVNETGEIDFLVQRVGNLLYFYNNQVTDEPVSPTLETSVIDLRLQALPGKEATLENSEVQFASGRGFLFVVGEELNPFSVEYIVDTGEFLVRPITVRIRDFVGVDDGLANDFEPPTLSDQHLYNLYNQGWIPPSTKIDNTVVNPVTGRTEYIEGRIGLSLLNSSFGGAFDVGVLPNRTLIDQYFDQIGLYPGNNKAWYVGRLEVADPDRNLEAGDFDPDTLCDIFIGNTRAARGHFITDAFNIDRSAISGVPNLPVQSSTTRPRTVSFYAGKVWYGHESDLYYSQTLLDYRQAGNCYQEADPTSETISDIIATDGGRIPIPEAHNIVKIQSVGGSLVVFAENGVWSVQGGQGGFSATDIAVTKISNNGILSSRSLVEANDAVYWWSDVGILQINQRSGLFGVQEGAFDRENVTLNTIQSFYQNRITSSAKMHCKGIFDPIRNIIHWLFQSENTGEDSVVYYDRVLNFDLTLNAFYPWTIANDCGRSIVGVHQRTQVFRIETPGIESQEGSDVFNSYVRYVYATKDTEVTDTLSFGDFHARDYSDFGDQPYLSFMETGFELLEDLMRSKQSTHLFLYFRRTDGLLGENEEGIDSSCFFQTKWDWSRNYNSNRWSRKVQGYRITRNFNEASVVGTRHKARGHGRALQVRFESSEIGKTFDLLGWAVNFTGNTIV